MSINKFMLLFFLIWVTTFSVLKPMHNSGNNSTSTVIVAERQQDAWQSGYRAVFNAWLVKNNRFIVEDFDFQDPLPSFDEWINRLRKIWATIFTDGRPFMNGKWEGGTHILSAWTVQDNLDTRALSTKDINLLVLLCLCIKEPLYKNSVKAFVDNVESFRNDTFALNCISVIHRTDFSENPQFIVPQESCLIENISRFKYDQQPQIVLMYENNHWTTMILVLEPLQVTVIDSCSDEARSIYDIVYTLFVTQPFPRHEELTKVYHDIEKVQSLAGTDSELFSLASTGLYTKLTENKNFAPGFVNHIFTQKSLPLPVASITQSYISESLYEPLRFVPHLNNSQLFIPNISLPTSSLADQSDTVYTTNMPPVEPFVIPQEYNFPEDWISALFVSEDNHNQQEPLENMLQSVDQNIQPTTENVEDNDEQPSILGNVDDDEDQEQEAEVQEDTFEGDDEDDSEYQASKKVSKKPILPRKRLLRRKTGNNPGGFYVCECEDCDESFDDAQVLYEHCIKIHLEIGKDQLYHCPWPTCTHRASEKASDIETYLQLHTGYKPTSRIKKTQKKKVNKARERLSPEHLLPKKSTLSANNAHITLPSVIPIVQDFLNDDYDSSKIIYFSDDKSEDRTLLFHDNKDCVENGTKNYDSSTINTIITSLSVPHIDDHESFEFINFTDDSAENILLPIEPQQLKIVPIIDVSAHVAPHNQVEIREEPVVIEFKCRWKNCDASTKQVNFESAEHLHKHCLEQHLKKSEDGTCHCYWGACRKQSNRFDSFKNHFLTHTRYEPFVCPQCNFSAGVDNKLIKHLPSHTLNEHEIKKIIKEIKKSLPDWFLKKAKTWDGNSPLSCLCEGCTESFDSEELLHKHCVENHLIRNENGLYYCSWVKCSVKSKEHRPFESKLVSGLKQHLHSHTRYNPFHCSECDHKTSKSSTLKRHLMREKHKYSEEKANRLLKDVKTTLPEWYTKRKKRLEKEKIPLKKQKSKKSKPRKKLNALQKKVEEDVEQEVTVDETTISFQQEELADERFELLTPCRLINQGANCFITSSLQCLSNISSFFYIMTHAFLSEQKHLLLSQLLDVFKKMRNDQNLPDTSSCFSLIRRQFFAQNQGHQDAHEFLTLLFAVMNHKILDKKLKEVWETGFTNTLSSVRTCNHCEHHGEEGEPNCPIISVEISNFPQRLEACVAHFFTSEKIVAYCEKCEEHRSCTKQLRLLQPARHLIIHAKRFDSKGAKLKSPVSFPLDNFSLQPFGAAEYELNQRYQMTGLILHYGDTLHHGHYVALIKNSENKWYLCDDATITEVEADDVVSMSRSGIFINQQRIFQPYVWFYGVQDGFEIE